MFGPAGDDLVAALLAAPGDPELATTAEAFLLQRLPGPDPNVALVNRVVDQVMADRDITQVKHLTDRTGIGTRRRQRLVATYTGVTRSGSSSAPACTRRSSATTPLWTVTSDSAGRRRSSSTT